MIELLPYLLIPFFTCFVAWFTNWLGIQMMFYPVNWVGIGNIIGWQGVMPRMRVKFTKRMVDDYISKLCTPEEMLDAVEESDAIEHIIAMISPHIEEIFDDIMEEQAAGYWELAPEAVRQNIYQQVRDQLPIVSHSILFEIKKRASAFVDVERIALKKAEENPGLMGELMQQLAGKEFRLVILSGIYIGFPLGIVQALLWYHYPVNWVLPAFGAFVGGATNWIALQYLVYPIEPKNIFGYTLQGGFIKRQAIVAKQFSHGFAHGFLDVDDIFDEMMYGKHRVELERIVRRQIRNILDRNIVSKYFSKAMRISGVGADFGKGAFSIVETRLVEELQRGDASSQFITPIADLLTERIARMDPRAYAELILPSFEEDKWILISVGAVLGALAGMAQLVYLFGGGI